MQSTLLNALIGERNALPTNGMRACTAVLAELSYAEDVQGYHGEVEFMTHAVSGAHAVHCMHSARGAKAATLAKPTHGARLARHGQMVACIAQMGLCVSCTARMVCSLTCLKEAAHVGWLCWYIPCIMSRG